MTMHEWIVYAIGFAAQLLFSARLLLQWIASEKNKKVTTPRSFWIHSLIASFLLFSYGYLRNDFPIMLGQVITYFIYMRNLQFEGIWQRQHFLIRDFLVAFPFIVTIYFFTNNRYDLHELLNTQHMPLLLLLWGSIGQVIFTGRFVYQWIYAEKMRRALLPEGFWWLSVFGSVMILTYAILRKDPVLFVGQLFGFVVYTRNLILIKNSVKI
jgi:lipid-A-disaccharide synthase-like uncharacterized protein